MQDVIIDDLVNNDIQINAMWNIHAFLSTMDNFDSMDDFGEDIVNGELHEVLQIPEEIEDAEDIRNYLLSLPKTLLIAKLYTPVKEDKFYSWGFTQGAYVIGNTLQELYNAAYRKFVK